MDKDFAATSEYLKTVKDYPLYVYNHNRFIKYIKDLFPWYYSGRVLDIGGRNPLTQRLEDEFDIVIDSTLSDLDIQFICTRSEYDIIIFNHVIEHLFNPLFCLQNIREVMHKDSILIIGTPIKPNFITTETGHFHEMDEYRFKKLIQRAGLEIINWQRFYTYNHISWRSFTGIRPFLKMFYKCHSIVKCIKQ